MNCIKKLLLFSGLVLASVNIAGQYTTLYPHCYEYAPFASQAEKQIDYFFNKARHSLYSGDLESLNDYIGTMSDLNVFFDPLTSGGIENQKGILEYYKNNNSSSLEHYLNAIDYFENAGSKDGLNVVMNNIAIIFGQIKDYMSTRKYLIKAIEYTPEEDVNSRAIYTLNLAETETRLKNHDAAIIIANDLLENFNPDKIEYSKLSVYSVFIGCYNSMRQDEKAEYWINEGMKIINKDISYLDKLSFYSELIEHYWYKKDYDKVLDYGSLIYPPPDSTFLRDIYESINLMVKAARETGKFSFANELDRLANNIEFTNTNLDRQSLINPLMLEYSYIRDRHDSDIIKEELSENNKIANTQRHLVISLLAISFVLLILIAILSRTKNIRSGIKAEISKENAKLETINTQLKESNDSLERENNLLDTLISVFAHDLINPFQAILGFSQLMISDSDILQKEDFIEYSGLLSETSFQLNQLLINLKGLSILHDRNEAQLKASEIKLSESVKSIIHLFEPSALKKEIDFENKIEEKRMIFINREIIEASLRNIISNAVKFSPPSSTIKIWSEVNNKMNVAIHIKDMGEGISEETINTLMKKKYTDSKSGTLNEKGSGIGIAICMELLELANSSLSFESKKGLGTTVTITVPGTDES